MTSKFVAAPYVAAGGGSGDTTGAASSTDNAIVRFDGTGGKTIQNSAITVSDTGNVSFPSGGGLVTPKLGGMRVASAVKIANYTLTLTDFAIAIDAEDDDRTITLPLASTAFVNGSGQMYMIVRLDSSLVFGVEIVPAIGDSINDSGSFAVGSVVTIIATSTTGWRTFLNA